MLDLTAPELDDSDDTSNMLATALEEDEAEDILYAVNKTEIRAAIQQSRNKLVPSVFSSRINRTLQNMHGTEDMGDIDSDDTWSIYDFADGIKNTSANNNDFDSKRNEHIYNENREGSRIEGEYVESDDSSQRLHLNTDADFDCDRVSRTKLSWSKDNFSIPQQLESTSKHKERDKRSLSRKFKRAEHLSSDTEMTSFLPSANTGCDPVDRFSNGSNITSFNQFKEYDPLTRTDLSTLPELTLDTITDYIERRYKHDLIYSRCGEVIVSVNPFKHLELCSYKYFKSYTPTSMSEAPHLFSISAKAYQGIQAQGENQIILVSGESGAGKTEATKFLVRHLTSIAGSEYEALQGRIIEVNPLLEAFGNAKTKLNANSSRFAKLLTLNINDNGRMDSARVRDYMLEKSRVVHHESRERTFHAFYAFLVGASDDVLESFYIQRGSKFRITGDFAIPSQAEEKLYRKICENQQNVYRLIKLTEDEIHDVHTILAAILHMGNIEFKESDNDSVVIKDEAIVHKVASLLQLDVKYLTKVLIERRGRLGKDKKTVYDLKVLGQKSPISRNSASMFRNTNKGNELDHEQLGSTRGSIINIESLISGEIIELSKNMKQAEDERDAVIKFLYERMFGWLVHKINDVLKWKKFSNFPTIGILDICGFENLDVNSFEQLCINLVNEQLQNFMNKKTIEDDRDLYLQEGIELEDVNTENINNDAILRMFMMKSGILNMIDEQSKLEISNDEILVSGLVKTFGNNGILIPPKSNMPEFQIQHFAGKVSYDGRSFIQKNRDTLSEAMKECFKMSKSPLIQDLFSVQPSHSGSVSMVNFQFQGSKQHARTIKTFPEVNLSHSINACRKESLQQKFGEKCPNLQSRDFVQRSTQMQYLRNSLSELVNCMKEAHPFFVRCIKPNDMQIPGEFWRDRVMTQLQYNGVKEIARIKNFVFPYKLSKESFKQKYGELSSKSSQTDLILDIMNLVKAESSHYQLGKTLIFMQEPVKSALESALAVHKMKQAEARAEEEARLIEEMRQFVNKNSMQFGEVQKHKRKKEDFKQLQNELQSFLTPGQSVPLSTIEETSTMDSSFQDGSIYNRVTTSSSGSNVIPQPVNEEEIDEESDEESTAPTEEDTAEEERVVL